MTELFWINGFMKAANLFGDIDNSESETSTVRRKRAIDGRNV